MEAIFKLPTHIHNFDIYRIDGLTFYDGSRIRKW